MLWDPWGLWLKAGSYCHSSALPEGSAQRRKALGVLGGHLPRAVRDSEAGGMAGRFPPALAGTSPPAPWLLEPRLTPHRLRSWRQYLLLFWLRDSDRWGKFLSNSRGAWPEICRAKAAVGLGATSPGASREFPLKGFAGLLLGRFPPHPYISSPVRETSGSEGG